MCMESVNKRDRVWVSTAYHRSLLKAADCHITHFRGRPGKLVHPACFLAATQSLKAKYLRPVLEYALDTFRFLFAVTKDDRCDYIREVAGTAGIDCRRT